MPENFLPNPASCDLKTMSTTQPPEPVKILVIGSPLGVTNTIHTLHRLGFAQVGEWSPLVPTQNQGEVMSILMRRLRLSQPR
ncbi:peptide ABC transporter substrate-binding protein [Oscillatoriales cyanobacterium LEGE 11467]|uniref:Peptide ABC transporter substrate-binding protein n=1 Tax=Zarconia navalis LEGE 11467 TaxID=1828826 RepID=A0A928VXF0_9CYAN|nr:peptide ABC transporter substrate-binding protein [Zarconia navalis]MBE9040036.1 peptide ABC transporter substrate-binding protein [Zarconia navalis LEGE 11467]